MGDLLKTLHLHWNRRMEWIVLRRGTFVIDWSTYSYTSGYQKHLILYGDEVYVLSNRTVVNSLTKEDENMLILLLTDFSLMVLGSMYHDVSQFQWLDRIFLTSLIFFLIDNSYNNSHIKQAYRPKMTRFLLVLIRSI